MPATDLNNTAHTLRRGKSYLLMMVAIIISVQPLFQCSCTPQHHGKTATTGKTLPAELARADSMAQKGDTEGAVCLYRKISEAGEADQPLDSANAHAALTAALLEAQIYFNHYTDYGRELEALNRASRIAGRHDLSHESIQFLMGMLCFTIADQHNAGEYFDQGARHFSTLLLDTHSNAGLCHDAASNLILYSHRANVRDIAQKALSAYFNDHRWQNTGELEFNQRLTELFNHINNGRFQQAMSTVQRIKELPEVPVERVLPGLYFIAGQIEAAAGHHNEALQCLQTAETMIAPQFGSDMQLEVWEALADAHKALGNTLRMGEYAAKANDLRRRISSFSQISSFKRAEMQEEMDHIQFDLTKEQRRANHLSRILGLTCTIALLIAIMAVILTVFLKKLKSKNRLLYLRYVELLKNTDCKEALQGAPQVTEPNKVQYTIDAQRVRTTVSDKENLQAAINPNHVNIIEQILADNNLIFSADFSAATLSVHTGIKPRTLSSVIAAHYGLPFRVLLNQRRVRAVCRILENTSDYDNLTVEAIAESVGIKSRTTFINAFRRETGMPPSQYMKFSRSSKQPVAV